ncbi:hypothetical protein IFR05_000437 [Cadophora sp. M221]|nr:hypothetical protein IFR05_000437 [Cadophora sp. M221]
MARTRSMAAPKLRQSGRKQEPAPAPAPAAKTSKPVGITKKKAATKAKPAPKPKAVRAPVPPTASKTTTKTSKRKASEIENENEAPQPKAKRAKATPAPAQRKPTTHRYGTRSKRLSSPLPPSPLAVPVLPPALRSHSPEREPGKEQGGDRHSSPPLPPPPPPSLASSSPSPFFSTQSPASSPPKPASQLPLPALDFAFLHPTNPVPFKYFSGKPLARLAVTSGQLEQREPLDWEHQSLEEIREDGKIAWGSQAVLADYINNKYMWDYKRKPEDARVYDHDEDPEVVLARLQNSEARAMQKKAAAEYTQMRLRQKEQDDGYGENFRKRNHPNQRLNVRTKHQRWSTVWKKKLAKFRQPELVKRAQSRQKWQIFRVHDPSPVAKDCSAELEEEAEDARLAREQFEADLAAGLVEDADEYGHDYDPWEANY